MGLITPLSRARTKLGRLCSRDFARRAGSLFLGRILSAALQMAILSMLARKLDVTNFGHFAVFSSGCLLALTATDLGFRSRAMRLVAEDEPRAVATSIVFYRLILNAVFVIGAAWLWHVEGAGQWFLGACVALYVTGETLGDVAGAWLVSIGRISLANNWLIARRALPLSLLFFVPPGPSALLALGAAGVLGHISASVTWQCVAARTIIDGTKLHSPRRILRDGWKFWATSAGTSLQQSDALLVDSLTSTVTAGLYGASTRLGNPLNLVTSLLLQLVIPDIAGKSAFEDRRRVMYRFWLLTSVYAFVLLLCVPFSARISTIAFGAAYEGAAPYTGGVLVAAAISAVSQPLMAWYYVHGLPSGLALWNALSVTAGLATLGVIGWLSHGSHAMAFAIPVGSLGIFLALLMYWRATVAAQKVDNSD